MKGRIVVSFTGKLQANWQTAVMLHFTDLISLMRFPLCLTVLTHKYPPKKQKKIVSDKPAIVLSSLYRRTTRAINCSCTSPCTHSRFQMTQRSSCMSCIKYASYWNQTLQFNNHKNSVLLYNQRRL